MFASIGTNPLQFEWLKDIDFLDLIIKVICIVIVVFFLVEFKDRFISKYGINTQRQREQKKNSDIIQKTNEDLAAVIQSVNTLEKSIDSINTSLERLTVDIIYVKQTQDDMQEKNRQSKQVEYKDQLYQAYMFYKERAESTGRKEWSKIEYDGFWSMFNDYESYGGNGYVHKIVEPYMREFVIKD